MQQKDKPRLAVLRNILAEVTNAAKTNKPLESDMQLLSLLRKRSAAAKTASAEFDAAGRRDLVEQEEQQARILEEYAGGVEVMSGEGLREVVRKVVEEVKNAAAGRAASMGDVLKRLIGPGGTLEGKPVEKVEVSRLVKEMMGKP